MSRNTIIDNSKIKYVDYFTLDRVLMLNLSGNQERVYRCLLSHKNRNQEYSFPSQVKIAEETRLNIKTVQRILKALVEKGFIVIKKMKKIIGHYNRYKLLYVPSMDVVRAKKEVGGQAQATIEEPQGREARGSEKSNVNKILSFTGIEKVSEKQRESLREFDTVVILQTIARIKSGITKMPRTATLLIAKLCDTAISLGMLLDWQYRKYGILKLKE